MKARQAIAAVSAAVVAAGGVWLGAGAPPARADGALASYRVVAQAAGVNWTYDAPTANFHPEADNELPYAEVDGDPTRAHAISSLYWPGAAGGNLGSLIAVLGGPAINQLNDPVRAEASTSSTDQQATVAPTGTSMTASVIPDSADVAQEASSAASWAGAPLGQGSAIGAISALAKQTLGKDGTLTAATSNSVANVDLGGMFHAGLIATSANEQSAAGGTPTLTSTMTVDDLTIGGQKAYVDGSGVHMGQPGKPAGSAVIDGVSKGLSGAGMQIYFTEPAKVTIGGVAYDYAPALLIYWAPPDDTNHDVFTFGFGGAAIQMVISGGDASSTGSPGGSAAASAGGTDLGAGGGGAASGSLAGAAPGGAPIPASPGSTTLQLPSTANGTGAALPHVLGNRLQNTASGQLAAAHSPGGIGAWWFLLLGLAAVAGAALAPRVPALFRTAAVSTCANERSTPNRRA
ncbi:MAG: hypothetical protein JO265_15255 [Acidimicrobiia bacterium]|nr:hypothetical protein [Acidimicrobiia bacterium]